LLFAALLASAISMLKQRSCYVTYCSSVYFTEVGLVSGCDSGQFAIGGQWWDLYCFI